MDLNSGNPKPEQQPTPCGLAAHPLRPGSPAPAPEPRLRTARQVFRELSYRLAAERALSTAGRLAVCLLACHALAGHHGLVFCLRHPSLHTPAGSPLAVFQGDTAFTPPSAGGLSLLSRPEVPGRPEHGEVGASPDPRAAARAQILRKRPASPPGLRVGSRI